MEFWVVAAAAGAYVATHWQNLTGSKNSPLKLWPVQTPRVHQVGPQQFNKTPDSVFPLPKLAKRCFLDDDVSSPEEELKTNNSNTKSFSSLRPLVVSRSRRDYQTKQMGKLEDVTDEEIVFMEENGASIEAEFFEPFGSVNLPRRLEKVHGKRFGTKDLISQGNVVVSLFLGITIGILSSVVTNQGELEHLNELLEQAENMVKDLHNKLEIKDGFNATNEHDTESNAPANYSPKGKKIEVRSEIEAELEAELEKMEESMQRVSRVVEIDPDFEADFARGDLNLNTLKWQLDSQSESDHDDKSNKSDSTGKPDSSPNYTVSPLDLRLRLHEVIESELRARIEELEAVLKGQNDQTYPDSPKPEEENSFWDFDHMRIESSSSSP